MSTSQIKRSVFFVSTPLQKRLMGLLFCALMAPVILVGLCLFPLTKALFGMDPAKASQELNLLLDANGQILIFFIALTLLIFVIWFFSVFITNRIVGPIERMTREVRLRADGTKTGPIKLRPGDEMQELAEQFNRFLEKKNGK